MEACAMMAEPLTTMVSESENICMEQVFVFSIRICTDANTVYVAEP